MSSKILIIDDDQRLVDIHSMLFEIKGFEVETALGGEVGLEKIAASKPDIVLLDAMMPAFSGFDTLAAIKANPEYRDIKVVMLTALSDEDLMKKAVDFGADCYIVKSQLTVEEIVAKVQELLQIKK
jgi:DNA-binding response OmpR family regulator